jgi:hypothetical protein
MLSGTNVAAFRDAAQLTASTGGDFRRNTYDD